MVRLRFPLSVDVTTGDKITLDAVVYEYPFAFDEGSARIMAYPTETVLAEKIETILARNVFDTWISASDSVRWKTGRLPECAVLIK